MEKLHRYRHVMRGAATRISTSTYKLLEDPDATASDFLAAIDALEEKDAILNELNTIISDLLDGEEFEEEVAGALEYHDAIRHTIRKLRFILRDEYGLTPDNPGVRAVTLPTYLLKAVQRERELASIAEHVETQTGHAELDAAPAPKETGIEAPTCGFESVSVPDFMNGDSLPEPPESRLEQVVEVVREDTPTPGSGSLLIREVGKVEQPILNTSARCDETVKPGRETADPCIELTPITKIKAPESDTTEDQTRATTRLSRERHSARNTRMASRQAIRRQLAETVFGIRSRLKLNAQFGPVAHSVGESRRW